MYKYWLSGMYYFYPQRILKVCYYDIKMTTFEYLWVTCSAVMAWWWRQCFIFILQEPFEYEYPAKQSRTRCCIPWPITDLWSIWRGNMKDRRKRIHRNRKKISFFKHILFFCILHTSMQLLSALEYVNFTVISLFFKAVPGQVHNSLSSFNEVASSVVHFRIISFSLL